jgi:hypothetical protein
MGGRIATGMAPEIAAVTDPAAREQLFLVLLGQVRDGLAATNSNIAEVSRTVLRVETDVVVLKTKDEKFVSLEAEHKANEMRIHALELAFARYQGLFMPLAVFGSSAVSALGVFIMSQLTKGAP